MSPNLDSILDILAQRGDEQYGNEAVSQLQHALQCAALAEEAGQTPGLIVASLLHDLGHLVHDLGESAADRGINDRHECRVIPFLRHLFDKAVTEPIRLHVDAKRYLCATDGSYWASLSPASKQSLELQGGIFSDLEAQEFVEQPYAQDAVQLRIWDDKAKVADLTTPDLDHFLPMMQRCLIRTGA